MPRKTRKQAEGDVNQWAAHAVASVTGMAPPKGVLKALLKRQATKKVYTKKNPAAVALGRLGGLKGGKARADSLSPRKRSEIARMAAQARWKAKLSPRPLPEPATIIKLVETGLTILQIEQVLELRPGFLNRTLSATTKAKLRTILERRASKLVDSRS
jgi:hypothetical protein